MFGWSRRVVQWQDDGSECTRSQAYIWAAQECQELEQEAYCVACIRQQQEPLDGNEVQLSLLYCGSQCSNTKFISTIVTPPLGGSSGHCSSIGLISVKGHQLPYSCTASVSCFCLVLVVAAMISCDSVVCQPSQAAAIKGAAAGSANARGLVISFGHQSSLSLASVSQGMCVMPFGLTLSDRLPVLPSFVTPDTVTESVCPA